MSKLFERLWKYKNHTCNSMITTVLKRDAYLPAREKWPEVLIKADTKVRIWMVSRFGDIGITDDLISESPGYTMRIGPTAMFEDDPMYKQEELETWIDNFELAKADLERIKREAKRLKEAKEIRFWEEGVLEQLQSIIKDQEENT